MNDNILRAIESLCDDIATSTNASDNQKKAKAILTLVTAYKLADSENNAVENTRFDEYAEFKKRHFTPNARKEG